MALPAGLQPRLREVPALAWTVTRAFTAVPPANRTRPGPVRLLSALWSVPAFMVLYLPLLLFSVWSGRVVRLDRRALLLVLPAGWPLERVKLTVPFAWLLATAGPVGLFAPVPVMVALGVPLVTDLAGVLVAACRAGPGSAGHAKQLAGQGHPVATVGLYAANPRGQGHGSALLDVLFEQAPAGDYSPTKYGPRPTRKPLWSAKTRALWSSRSCRVEKGGWARAKRGVTGSILSSQIAASTHTRAVATARISRAATGACAMLTHRPLAYRADDDGGGQHEAAHPTPAARPALPALHPESPVVRRHRRGLRHLAKTPVGGDAGAVARALHQVAPAAPEQRPDPSPPEVSAAGRRGRQWWWLWRRS